jgi:hypothetical protein
MKTYFAQRQRISSPAKQLQVFLRTLLHKILYDGILESPTTKQERGLS